MRRTAFVSQMIRKMSFNYRRQLPMQRPRRFAPLDKEKAASFEIPRLKGIVFDVDGTLCLPQQYMFAEMRSVLGIDKSIDILEHIRGLPTLEERRKAAASIEKIEQEAMAHQQPQPGLIELMDYLQRRNVRCALCTRNFETPITHLLTNFLSKYVFSPQITRNTPDVLPKPDPAGLLHIAREWQLDDRAESLIMVGDSIDDMTAGYAAGAATVLLLNEHNAPLRDHAHTDLAIERLDDLIAVLENGFVGQNTTIS